MPFEPGRAKTGGRTKGTANRATQALKKALEDANFDVVTEILAIYPELDNGLKTSILKDLMQYLYPKLKAIEHSGEIDGAPVTVVAPASVDDIMTVIQRLSSDEPKAE